MMFMDLQLIRMPTHHPLQVIQFKHDLSVCDMCHWGGLCGYNSLLQYV